MNGDQSPTTIPCICCGSPSTRTSRDGVPLCDGDYEYLLDQQAEADEWEAHNIDESKKRPQVAPRALGG